MNGRGDMLVWEYVGATVCICSLQACIIYHISVFVDIIKHVTHKSISFPFNYISTYTCYIICTSNTYIFFEYRLWQLQLLPRSFNGRCLIAMDEGQRPLGPRWFTLLTSWLAISGATLSSIPSKWSWRERVRKTTYLDAKDADKKCHKTQQKFGWVNNFLCETSVGWCVCVCVCFFGVKTWGQQISI